jgi:hypothetical protein
MTATEKPYSRAKTTDYIRTVHQRNHAMKVFSGKKRIDQFRLNRIIAFAMLALGIVFLALSAFYNTVIAAVIGLGLAFWGAILLYVTPSKHVALELLNATVTSALSNSERIIAASKANGRGFYLPPRYLKDLESSLVYISPNTEQTLPPPGEIDEDELYQKKSKGICLRPPGLALSKLLEKELGTSFTRTDLNIVQDKLPKLLIEDTEIADNAQVKIENASIIIEITNHVLKQVCRETRNLPRTHQLMGCPLSSAIACALAKATGKPITIENEEETPDEKITKITYRLLEG